MSGCVIDGVLLVEVVGTLARSAVSLFVRVSMIPGPSSGLDLPARSTALLVSLFAGVSIFPERSLGPILSPGPPVWGFDCPFDTTSCTMICSSDVFPDMSPASAFGFWPSSSDSLPISRGGVSPSVGPNVHIHSRLLFRRPCTGVEGISSASSSSLLSSSGVDTRRRFSLEVLESESEASDSSIMGVGIISTRLSWNTTLFTGGNIRRGARAEVADVSRRGRGLLRRMLREPIGRL